MGPYRWWLGKRLFIITNYTLIDLTPSPSCQLQLTHQSVFMMTFFVFYSSMFTVKHPSALPNDIPEESGHFPFLRAACLPNIKGEVGLILEKPSGVRISIPLDLSSRPFIPPPRFILSRRPTTLLSPSLVFSPLRSA